MAEFESRSSESLKDIVEGSKNTSSDPAREYDEETTGRDVGGHSGEERETLEDEKVRPYDEEAMKGEGGADKDLEGRPMSRQPTLLERIQTSYSFFNENLKKERKLTAMKFLFIYLVMAVGVMATFSIYWGSYYQRNTRLKNLRMLVVNEDDTTIDGIEPVIGNTMSQVLKLPAVMYRGNWHLYNLSHFNKVAEKHGNSVEAEIEREIHHQEYWASIYIKPNATYNLYKAIVEGDQKYNVSNSSVVSIYETGRDFLNMGLYVVPGIEVLQSVFLASQPNMTDYIVSKLPSSNKSDIFLNQASIKLIAAPLLFTMYDRVPFTDPVLVAPCQVGLIYMIIITFFQVNFFGDVHKTVAQFKIKKHHYLLYRILSSILSFFVLSLFFGLVTIAMRVDFTVTYGKSGFLVYWMIAFITMWAVGMLNEIMAMVFIMVYPPLIGFWMLFWVIINISTSFSPIALCPEFFRYGYAMPIHNSFEATKTVFFDVYKGQVGRNIGILFAWIAILTPLLPLVIIKFNKVMMQRAQQAAAAAAAAKEPENK